MQYALVIGQVMVVVFLAFHDWVPLGAFALRVRTGFCLNETG
jgi:hypothetical protein